MEIRNIILAGICVMVAGCMDKDKPRDIPYLYGQQYSPPVNYCIKEENERICFSDEVPYGSLDLVMEGDKKILPGWTGFQQYNEKWEKKVKPLYLE
ncbi:MAG: hypothetical protein WCV90_07340 [Candidatus Woesearchaeota archaeon]